MRSFVEELKNRSYPLFIAGLLFYLCAFFCFSFIFLEKHQLGDSIPFRTSLNALYTAIMLWSLGWMNEYLYKKNTRKLFSVAYVTVSIVFLFLAISTLFRDIIPHPNASLPYDRFAHLIYVFTLILFILIVLLNTRLLFIQKKMPVSQQYTWGVRLGYLIFLWPLCMELIAQLFVFNSQKISSSRFTFLMNQWNSPVGGLRLAYLMGIFALQLLPLTSNYIFKKKREVQIFSLCYFLCMVLLVAMTLLRQPLLPA